MSLNLETFVQRFKKKVRKAEYQQKPFCAARTEGLWHRTDLKAILYLHLFHSYQALKDSMLIVGMICFCLCQRFSRKTHHPVQLALNPNEKKTFIHECVFDIK